MKHPSSKALVFVLVMLSWGCNRSPEQKVAKLLASAKESSAKQDYPRALLQIRSAIQIKPKAAESYYQLGLVFLASGDADSAGVAFWRAAELNPKHIEAQLRLSELLLRTGRADLWKNAESRVDKVLAVAPANVDAQDLQALSDWQAGRRQAAEQRFQTVLNRFPADLRASVNLALAKLTQSDVAAAERILKKAVETSPTSDGRIALAEFYLRVNRPVDAEQELQLVLKSDPKNPLALIDVAEIQLHTGRKNEAEQTYRQISDLPPRQYKPIHALYLFASGQTGPAIVELEKLARENPQDRSARTRLVTAYLRVNRTEDAFTVLNASLKKNEKDVDALIQRSRAYVSTGKYTEAQKDVLEAIHFQPNSAEAHYYLAKVHQTRGANLNYRQELGEALKCDSNYLTARIELAQALIATKASKAAVDLMNQTPDWQKKSTAVVVQRNWALMATGDRAEVRKNIDQALATAKTPDLLIQDAILKSGSGAFDAARVSLREALKADPGNVQALNLLARTFISQKQPANAIQAVKEYAAAHPESAAIQQYCGEALLAVGDRAQARAAFLAAQHARADFSPAQLGLARLDLTEGKIDEARKRLASLVTAKGASTAARLLMADVEQSAGNQSAALEQYRLIAQNEPSNAVALNNLAYLSAEYANQPDEALKYAERAKELLPDNPEVEDTLGWILYRKGLYSLAVRHLENSAGKETTGRGTYHLAMAYYKAGDRRKGRLALETAMRKDPNLPEAKLAERVRAESERSPAR